MDFTAMMQRVVRAVTFDVKFYQEAKDDASLSREALIVVIIAVALGAIGSIWGGFGAIFGALVSGVVGYYAWAYITHLVGTNFFHGTGTFPQLQRTLGYAWAPAGAGHHRPHSLHWLGGRAGGRHLVAGVWRAGGARGARLRHQQRHPHRHYRLDCVGCALPALQPHFLGERGRKQNSCPRKGRKQRKKHEGHLSCGFRCFRPFRGQEFCFLLPRIPAFVL